MFEKVVRCADVKNMICIVAHTYVELVPFCVPYFRPGIIKNSSPIEIC